MTEQTLEKNKKKIKISNLHEIGLLIALILVLLLFSFTTENFFTQRREIYYCQRSTRHLEYDRHSEKMRWKFSYLENWPRLYEGYHERSWSRLWGRNFGASLL